MPAGDASADAKISVRAGTWRSGSMCEDMNRLVHVVIQRVVVSVTIGWPLSQLDLLVSNWVRTASSLMARMGRSHRCRQRGSRRFAGPSCPW
jgi:hypothetical protein